MSFPKEPCIEKHFMAWWFSQLEHLNKIQWSWDQILLRPTFYSYFKKSFSGEYHMYQFIPLLMWLPVQDYAF